MCIRDRYYKAALSGAKSIGDSDAGYVKKIAGITQEDTSLLSYLYQNAVSPHLAAQIEGNPVDPEKIKKDFDKVKSKFDYVTVEGSGGIVCPIRWDKEHKILLEDIVKALNLNTLVIADAGLGTINAVVLTIEYIRNHGMGVKGVIPVSYTHLDVYKRQMSSMVTESVSSYPRTTIPRESPTRIALTPASSMSLAVE